MFKYNCASCSIHTNNKQTYDRHILSIRHKETNRENTLYLHICNKCNKKYKSNVGLWKHSSKCIVIPQDNTSIQELKETITELKTMIIDLKEHQQPINTMITNNNNNNHNNFNVNLFLNEKCTGAKNFMDMINGIELDTEYHEYITSADYVDSIVRLIKCELDKLPIIERPIHCIKNEDENQQILHIRHNNIWSKETELEWTQQIHNYYIDDEDEPSDENKKIIFYAIKQMEDNIIEQIQKLYEHTGKLASTKREYKCEMNYVPNKMRIIKCLIEHVNLDRDEILRIIDETYKQLQPTS